MKQSRIGKKNRPKCTRCGSRNIRYSPDPWLCKDCGLDGGLDLFHRSKKEKR